MNSSLSSLSSESSGPVHDNNKETYHNLDFKIIVEQKSGPPITVHLMASTMQEKQAWVTDIGQVQWKTRTHKSFLFVPSFFLFYFLHF